MLLAFLVSHCFPLFSFLFESFADLELFREWTLTITIWGNGSSPSSSCFLHGLVSVPGTSASFVPVYRSHIPRMGILETVELPIHGWLYSTLEILLHLVNFRSLYYYFWLGFYWMDRIFSTKAMLGPCQKC